MGTHTITTGVRQGAGRRFYRPELDALRFFAFLAVLLHHGPTPGHFLRLARAAGGYGLSMFFLLSAYLITELLLREREQSGRIAWGLFFARRALRIWPLYYAALAG
jgi:peptidoglycan/LPS O-acetylase OafA/YrhL